jgi:hypothetical protein
VEAGGYGSSQQVGGGLWVLGITHGVAGLDPGLEGKEVALLDAVQKPVEILCENLAAVEHKPDGPSHG